jgi:hypothetical protein
MPQQQQLIAPAVQAALLAAETASATAQPNGALCRPLLMVLLL